MVAGLRIGPAFAVGNRTTIRRMPPTSVDLPLRGFAVTNSRDVYGHLHDYSKPTALQGLCHLEFDRVNGTVRWEPVRGASGQKDQAGIVTGLWSADGESIVHNLSDDPAGRMAVSWSTIARNAALVQ
jgi:hypothetical protein